MGFDLYHLECLAIAKHLRDLKLIPKNPFFKDPIKDSIYCVLKFAKYFELPILTGLDVKNLIDEYAYHMSNDSTIFIESTKLLEMIYKSKFDVHYDEISLPISNILSIAFPQNFIINGVEIKGCMFSKYNRFKIYQEMCYDLNCLDWLAERRSLGLKDEDQFAIILKGKDEKGFPVTFRSEFLPSEINKTLTSDDYILERIKTAFNQNNKPYDDLTILSEFAKEMQNFTYDLNKNDAHKINVFLRLCLGVCIYISAFPQSLQQGLPGEWKFKRVGFPQIFSRTSVYNILSPSSTHKSPEMHIRSWHFRALRDIRYKRNNDGSVRIIPVSSSIVGGKITPYHVENDK